MTNVNAGCEGTRATLDAEPSIADRELLGRFAATHDAAAFEKLVHRHGPLVLSVCRRMLRDPHAADDAFQATFLVLVRKAHVIRRPELLGNWLYGVAYRVASRARVQRATRLEHELGTSPMPEDDATSELERRELQHVLDEEFNRLPQVHRRPLVLCYLQGKTHAQAARLLGIPVGSMSHRLAVAREKLRSRLSRRGLSTSAGLFAALLFANTVRSEVPRALIEDTMRAAMAAAARKTVVLGASAKAAELARSVLHEMRLHAMKATLILVALVTSIGVLTVRSACLGSSDEAAAQETVQTWSLPSYRTDAHITTATAGREQPESTGAGTEKRGSGCGRQRSW